MISITIEATDLRDLTDQIIDLAGKLSEEVSRMDEVVVDLLRHRAEDCVGFYGQQTPQDQRARREEI